MTSQWPLGRGSAPTIVKAEEDPPTPIHDPKTDRALAISRMLQPAPAVDVRAETCERVLAILASEAHPGETIATAFTRKERELGAVFGRLDLIEARVLHGRLSRNDPRDLLAERFSRLTAERRIRLLAFLADARRREVTRAVAR